MTIELLVQALLQYGQREVANLAHIGINLES